MRFVSLSALAASLSLHAGVLGLYYWGSSLPSEPFQPQSTLSTITVSFLVEDQKQTAFHNNPQTDDLTSVPSSSIDKELTSKAEQRTVPLLKNKIKLPQPSKADSSLNRDAYLPENGEVKKGSSSGALESNYCPSPPYPPEAQKRGLEGTVWVRMLVNPAGNVKDAQIIQSSGFECLDINALNTVKTWRFSKTSLGGGLASVEIDQPIEYALEKN